MIIFCSYLLSQYLAPQNANAAFLGAISSSPEPAESPREKYDINYQIIATNSATSAG